MGVPGMVVGVPGIEGVGVPGAACLARLMAVACSSAPLDRMPNSLRAMAPDKKQLLASDRRFERCSRESMQCRTAAGTIKVGVLCRD